MYALAARSMTLFPADFRTTDLPKQTRRRLGTDMLVARKTSSATKEGCRPHHGCSRTILSSKEVAGLDQHGRENRLKSLYMTDVGRMFVEAGLDCTEFLYYKGKKVP